MKLVYCLIAAGVISSNAYSQNKAPNPNPPIGGLESPGTPINSPAAGARREIMRDSIQRQYTADEIDKYRQAIEAYERSKTGIYDESAKIVRRRIAVGVSPDSVVEEIRLNAESVGSIVFTDSLGNPWPVDDVLVPNYLKATKTKNMVVFEPKSEGNLPPQKYGRGSITFLLEGMNSTIPFMLSYGYSRLVDGQIEAQIQTRNRASITNTVQSDLIESDQKSELFLDGEPPKEAKELKTSIKSVKAWLYNGKLYLRTPLQIHSPAYKMYAASASGTSVFRFDVIPSIVNAIVDGSIVSVSIGD
jgi:hypothetical protein